MSEASTPRPPNAEPFGDATDEAVSALLDDELAAFAADHGISESEAMERLTAWAELESRTAELSAARAALQDTALQESEDAESDGLSELDRKRLVRNALAASSSPPAKSDSADSPRRRRVSQRLLAAAAAVVVIIGIGAAISRLNDSGGNDSASKSSATGGATTPTPRQGNLGNVGDVTNAADLRALLDPKDESAKTSAPRSSQSQAADSSAGELTAGGSDSGAGSTPTTTAAATPAPPTAAADACAAQLAGTRPVVLTATGTYRGAPAVIVGIQDKGRTILFVVPPDDCTNVLTSVSR